MGTFYLKTPVSESEIRNLKIGDTIYITGEIFLMRDEGHERALQYARESKQLPYNIEGLAVYHCGPVVEKINDEWKVISAGPTTSYRMELFEADFIKHYKVRIVIGKGGMGEKTIEAMNKYGAIFAAFTGGAGVILPDKIKKVKDVFWLDLGTPEAFWIFEVENFGPLVVAIDSHGNSLYKEIEKEIENGRKEAYKYLGI